MSSREPPRWSDRALGAGLVVWAAGAVATEGLVFLGFVLVLAALVQRGLLAPANRRGLAIAGVLVSSASSLAGPVASVVIVTEVGVTLAAVMTSAASLSATIAAKLVACADVEPAADQVSEPAARAPATATNSSAPTVMVWPATPAPSQVTPPVLAEPAPANSPARDRKL